MITPNRRQPNLQQSHAQVRRPRIPHAERIRSCPTGDPRRPSVVSTSRERQGQADSARSGARSPGAATGPPGLGRYPLLVVDEVGHSPFEPESRPVPLNREQPLRAPQPHRQAATGPLSAVAAAAAAVPGLAGGARVGADVALLQETVPPADLLQRRPRSLTTESAVLVMARDDLPRHG